MHVCVLRMELRLPKSRSMGDKRAALRPIIEGARNRFSVAIVEVDDDGNYEAATLSVTAVSATTSRVETVLQSVQRFVSTSKDVKLVAVERSWLGQEP